MTITTEANRTTSSKLFTLDATQQQAVDLACDTSKRVVGVTGAAGSGKTTILQQRHTTH
jgi:ABC-type sulfate/molybdate transport systems ATPase subunit